MNTQYLGAAVVWTKSMPLELHSIFESLTTFLALEGGFQGVLP